MVEDRDFVDYMTVHRFSFKKEGEKKEEETKKESASGSPKKSGDSSPKKEAEPAVAAVPVPPPSVWGKPAPASIMTPPDADKKVEASPQKTAAPKTAGQSATTATKTAEWMCIDHQNS